jgi:hypothetical protein
MVSTVGVRREVAPGLGERCANRPAIRHRIVDVHFVGRIGCLPAATHYIHRVAQVKASRFGCGPRYRGNVTDSIGHRIVNKRDGAIMKERAVISAATAGVNEVANRGLWNVTELRRQVRVLVGPYQRDWIELPDIVIHGHIYVKAAQDIHVIVIHGETAGDEILITGWPVSRHGADGVSDRVITENPPRGRLGGNLRAACAVDVVRTSLVQYAARHVVDLIVRIRG